MNMAAAPLPTNTTFEPSSDLIQEEDCNTLLLYLPGFTKEQLKVQLTRSRDLKISGVRQLENNKLSSFQKDFHVAENCDTNKITAKFEDGILYVRQPKYPQKTNPPLIPPPPPHKPAADHPRPPPKLDQPKNTRDIDQSTANKSVDQSKETKKSSDKKEDGKKEDIRPRGADEKSAKGAVSNRAEEDYSKLNAARLKAARQQITNALLLLFAFALGIYVAKLPWFSTTEKP